MDLESIVKYATLIALVSQVVVLAVPGLVALWVIVKYLRAQDVKGLIPAAVALTQDAKAMSWIDKGAPLADVVGTFTRNLQELARTRGLGSLTQAEIDHAKAMGSALHKANKMSETGYTGDPSATPPDDAPSAATISKIATAVAAKIVGEEESPKA